MIKNFKSWIVAAAVRAIKTFAQALLANIGMGAAILGDVNWGLVMSSAALAAILSIATSVTGLPEVKVDTTDAKGENTEKKDE